MAAVEIIVALTASGGSLLVAAANTWSGRRSKKLEVKTEERCDIRRQLQTLWEETEKGRKECEDRYSKLAYEHLDCRASLKEMDYRIRRIERKSDPSLPPPPPHPAEVT